MLPWPLCKRVGPDPGLAAGNWPGGLCGKTSVAQARNRDEIPSLRELL